jgi:hypothetical protein
VTNPEDPFAAPGEQPPPPDGAPPPPAPPPPGYGTPPPPYGAPPPGYAAPPPGYGAAPYGAPAQQGTNTLAIIGFVAAFLCGIAGIVMGIIAMNQIKQSGQKGQGLAIAAIAVGALNIVLSIAIASGN